MEQAPNNIDWTKEVDLTALSAGQLKARLDALNNALKTSEEESKRAAYPGEPEHVAQSERAQQARNAAALGEHKQKVLEELATRLD